MLDANKDGTVDEKEFTEGMVSLKIPSFNTKLYKDIFKAIDYDENKFLSVNEFCMHI